TRLQDKADVGEVEELIARAAVLQAELEKGFQFGLRRGRERFDILRIRFHKFKGLRRKTGGGKMQLKPRNTSAKDAKVRMNTEVISATTFSRLIEVCVQLVDTDLDC
ncbi:MAG: hypothetical protein WCS94_22065, partial [Verrucomicrobiota bacterium]